MSAPADKFQFTCPLRSTTLWSVALAYDRHVSIHVPLAEHDSVDGDEHHQRLRFNSRAPRGARLQMSASLMPCFTFQFTCPSRSTTRRGSASPRGQTFQFTCPSRSTTHDAIRMYHGFSVSIHVPLAEHDVSGREFANALLVSIHVPLAEHDW